MTSGSHIPCAEAAHGLGEAEASPFAAEGAQVVLTDVDTDAGSVSAKRLGSDAMFVQHDISSETEWTKVRLLAEERV